MHKDITGRGRLNIQSSSEIQELYIILIAKGEGECRQFKGEQMMFKKDKWAHRRIDERCDCCLYSVAKSCPVLCDPTDCSMPGFSILHYLPELTQTHVHWVNDAIQLSHPLPPPSPPALHLSQHQGFLQWVGSSHQVAKVMEPQLQHQSFPWIFKVNFL